MVDFNALRSRKGGNFAALQKKLENTGQNGFKKDDRFWKPVANKDNISQNIIRFLPIPYVDMVAVEEGKIKEEDLTPMAKILKHMFQGPKGWYIENSLATFGEECAVRQFDGPLWGIAKKNNDEILKNTLKKRLPNTANIAGILVIKDGTNPENNGKVFLYEFGAKVREALDTANKPKFDTDPSFDPFDAFDGANLIMNLTYTKKKIGEKEHLVADFSAIKWAPQSPLAGGDEAEIERIWKSQHSIADFYDRKHFKTFEELTAKYKKVMGLDDSAGPAKASSAQEMLNEMTGESKVAAAPAAPTASAPSVGKTESAPAAGSTDDDDAMAEFERLLAGN